MDDLGSADAASHTHNAAAVAAVAARTLPGAVARANAAKKAGSEALVAAWTLRSHRHLLGVGSAELGHWVVLRQLHRGGWLNQQLRSVDFRGLKRNDRSSFDELRQGSLGWSDQLMCATASASALHLDDRHDRRRGWIVESELNGCNCGHRIHNGGVNHRCKPQDGGDEDDMQGNRNNGGAA
jgi:hypothetical protein